MHHYLIITPPPSHPNHAHACLLFCCVCVCVYAVLCVHAGPLGLCVLAFVPHSPFSFKS